MLPEIRNQEFLFDVPKFSITSGDVKHFINELKGFHEVFNDCFHRSESRDHFFRYMVGQFSELERKSIEPIALKVEHGNVRPMQRFISDAEWDDDKMLTKYHNLINEDMGSADGVLIFDETGFVKKGNDSIAVGRQYCGSIGKVENCQVGVFAAYASPYGYSLLDKRLFIPEKWFSDDYKVRRKKCKLPENSEFKTKPQLAVKMFNNIVEEGVVPFRYVLGDSLYGTSPEFIKAVDSCVGAIYFVEVPADTRCWLKQPVTREKQYKYKGENRSKTVLEKTEKKPISVSTLAKNINDYFWYRRKVSEGTKGPIEYEFTRRRIILSNNGLPQKTIWLIMRRTIEDRPVYKYYLSNAPTSARLSLFVWLSGIRWAVEQCFEETKSELGMDHYEVRKYTGWQHHILTCMLAHFFLWHLKIRLGKKSTIYYTIAA
jgi:SRSO17 transposase